MLPWRAIPVTLAHWREPQIIISPMLSLPLSLSLDSGLSFYPPSSIFSSLSCSFTHTAVPHSLFPFFFSAFSLVSTHLFFLMPFIIISSCSLLSHSSVFILILLLVVLHNSLKLIVSLTRQQNEWPGTCSHIYQDLKRSFHFTTISVSENHLSAHHLYNNIASGSVPAQEGSSKRGAVCRCILCHFLCMKGYTEINIIIFGSNILPNYSTLMYKISHNTLNKAQITKFLKVFTTLGLF